jgi:hypothetical protein
MASPLRLFTRTICQSASTTSASSATRSKLRIMQHPGPVEISMHRKVSKRFVLVAWCCYGIAYWGFGRLVDGKSKADVYQNPERVSSGQLEVH